ncbi:hypothetical protein D3C86_868860 [compost metagenome]
MAKRRGFAEIQHLHDFEVEQANLHGALEQGIQIARIRAEPAHDAVEFGRHGAVLLIQHPGVLHVGGGALEAVEAEQAQPHDVFVDLALAAIDRGLGRMGQLFQQFGTRLEAGGGGQLADLHRQRGQTVGQLLAISDRLVHIADDAGGVEVDVGEGGEEGLGHEGIDLVIDDAVLAGGQRPGAEALQRIDQHILQIRGFRRLAAHALCVSAAVACGGTNCLFTLHTKHHASPNWTFQLLVLWRFYSPDSKLNRHSIYQLRFH